MSLTPGTRLGPYEIVAPIGAGGMGEVYRASDTRLERSVAIKVLPAEFASNAQLKARFEREARAISSLNHPNICTLYDVGRHDGIDYLVLEYIEGETLAERIGRGALPIEAVIRIGTEIAAALERAHRAGIVHRDLKPGNVILTRSGAKLLDFGLARSTPAFAPISQTDVTVRPGNEPLTEEGVVVGTFQYMAPEQIEGGVIDARSDIFALGAVLYEMATGRRAFEGQTRASLIAQILEHDPPPISTVQPMTPRALERVVRTCLAKHPDDRFQTAHDVELQLRWLRDDVSHPDTAAMPAVRRRANRERVAWAVAALAVVAAVVAVVAMQFRPRDYTLPTRTFINPPPETSFISTGDFAGPPVISPDGRLIVFSAATLNGQRSLWVRPLSSPQARPLEGTVDAQFPFWSPDGRRIGFFARGWQLKTIDAGGGPATVVADMTDAPRGGAWLEDGTIVLAAGTRSGLSRIPASGGKLEPLTKLSGTATSHRWPVALPGGKWILYLAANHNKASSPDTAIHAVSLDGKADRVLLPTLANVAYASGRLLFLRDTTLFAQALDPSSLRFSGEPQAVAQNVRFDLSIWRGVFDASQNGALIFQTGGVALGTQPTWHDATGKQLGTIGAPGRYSDVRLSPDARYLATAIGDPHTDLFVIDLQRNTANRLTFEGQQNFSPVWSPDGAQLVYATSMTDISASTIYARPRSGGAARKICCSKSAYYSPLSISPDGKTLLADDGLLGAGHIALTAIPVAGGEPVTLVGGPFEVFDGAFSPDGRWIAYTSNENGRREAYAIPYPPTGAKWQISNDGATYVRWSRDGKHLYYTAADDTLILLDLDTSGSAVVVGERRPLFRVVTNSNAVSSLDVAADGRILTTGSEASGVPLTLVTNWTR